MRSDVTIENGLHYGMLHLKLGSITVHRGERCCHDRPIVVVLRLIRPHANGTLNVDFERLRENTYLLTVVVARRVGIRERPAASEPREEVKEWFVDLLMNIFHTKAIVVELNLRDLVCVSDYLHHFMPIRFRSVRSDELVDALHDMVVWNQRCKQTNPQSGNNDILECKVSS